MDEQDQWEEDRRDFENETDWRRWYT